MQNDDEKDDDYWDNYRDDGCCWCGTCDCTDDDEECPQNEV